MNIATGEIADLTTGEQRSYTPMAADVRVMIEEGGMRGLMTKFLQDHPQLGVAPEQQAAE